nr:multiple epidermal growth factor-like domains protein 10 [Crassostrea gigas]
MDELFDGDSKTYKMFKGHDPYVRFQFNTSAKIDQLDITLVLEYGITYTVFVKQNPYIYLESEICDEFTHSDVSTERTVTVTCNRPLQGTYIEIVASSPSETTLKVLEIERFECSNGTYGENCSKICPDGCNNQCDKNTGDCICKGGRWGNLCNRTCPSFCDKNTCDSNTGDCYKCVIGYYGVKCDKECSFGCQNICNMTSGICSCKSGFYLSNCSLTCASKCLNNECHQEKGTCLACHNGTYGDFCDLNCLGDCNGRCNKEGICGICANNKYGTYCNQTCPKNCEAGVCKRGTGYCENCKKDYMGEKCDISCPEHCEDCSQNGYECKLCVDKWYGVKCELNCPPGCGENGSCNIESGMCNGCPAGYYGNKCTQKCSNNCASNKICDQSTGDCRTCKAGWYGLNCSEHCNSNCMNSTCFSNQSCAFGCRDGWFGAQCYYKCGLAIRNCGQCDLIENVPVCRHCSDRWYLMETNCFECPKNCSSCMSDEECLECKNNFYHGKTCNSTCNTACINKTCDMTGYCKEGCEDGRYGVRCDQNCLEHCKTCHNSTTCLQCEDGYFGESCQMCPKNYEKCENYSRCPIGCKVCTNLTVCSRSKYI